MIGNLEEAQFIYNWYRNIKASYYDRPDGWQYLGSGCYRTAYLSPSGVVYKVEQSEGSWQSNRGEYETWKRLYLNCKMPKHSRLPKLSYFPVGQSGVIAIERFYKPLNSIRREENDLGFDPYSVQNAIQEATEVGDLWGSNIYLDEEQKVLVPTDLAAPSY